MDWFKYLRLNFVAIFFLTALQLFGQLESDARIIVIDPGHGGIDYGAIGMDGVKEKDIALKVAREILNLNVQNDKKIYLTRYTDTLISLNDRVLLAKALKADLFISFHLNHANSPTAKGMEIFVASGEFSNNKNDAILLAYKIHKKTTSETGIMGRGVKFANFQVLKQTIPHMPSLLVEMCFLSNPDEQKFVANKNNIKAIAFLIYNIL